MYIGDMFKNCQTKAQATEIKNAQKRKNFQKYCEGYYGGIDEYLYHDDVVDDEYEKCIKNLSR